MVYTPLPDACGPSSLRAPRLCRLDALATWSLIDSTPVVDAERALDAEVEFAAVDLLRGRVAPAQRAAAVADRDREGEGVALDLGVAGGGSEHLDLNVHL